MIDPYPVSCLCYSVLNTLLFNFFVREVDFFDESLNSACRVRRYDLTLHLFHRQYTLVMETDTVRKLGVKSGRRREDYPSVLHHSLGFSVYSVFSGNGHYKRYVYGYQCTSPRVVLVVCVSFIVITQNKYTWFNFPVCFILKIYSPTSITLSSFYSSPPLYLISISIVHDIF